MFNQTNQTDQTDQTDQADKINPSTVEIETVHFHSGAECLAWHKRILASKALKTHYDRIPKWSLARYADAHAVEGRVGKRGGTFLSNMQFFVSTAQGKMQHTADNAELANIDRRGGVTLIIAWRI